MGSTGAGHFSDYTHQIDDKGETGGTSGEDKCLKAFDCILEDVAQSSYYNKHHAMPPIHSTINISWNASQHGRVMAVEQTSGLDCGALPTAYNYVASCISNGHSYVGVITNTATQPIPIISIDVTHI